jgi:hypothetical protein
MMQGRMLDVIRVILGISDLGWAWAFMCIYQDWIGFQHGVWLPVYGNYFWCILDRL